MDKKKENCIFISANKNFLAPLKVCLFSILKNYPNHPDIILCYTDFSKEELIELLQMTDKIIPMENNLGSLDVGPIMDHLPPSTDPRVFYARFLLRKSEIFENYNNVLHLDADTLVMKDLDGLMVCDEFYSVQEAYTGIDKIFKDHNDVNLLAQLQQDSISIGDKSSNSGVFLLPPQYRTQRHYEDIKNLMNSYGPYIKWADQSILNTWMYKHNIPIQSDFTYNFQHRLIENESCNALIEAAHIVHFNGVESAYRLQCMKNFLAMSNKDGYADRYREYYRSLYKG